MHLGIPFHANFGNGLLISLQVSCDLVKSRNQQPENLGFIPFLTRPSLIFYQLVDHMASR
jgi:hypothetical protein